MITLLIALISEDFINGMRSCNMMIFLPTRILSPGWHIPTENDWNTLFAVYTNNGFAGSPLKFSGFSGFNALLAGANYYNTSWDFKGFATFFWSSTLHSPTKAWAHGMNDPDPSVSAYPATRVSAVSVRCLED